MLKDDDDDYITSMAIGLFLSNRLSKNFRSMNNTQHGIVNGDFIREHLRRESELEEKCNLLEQQITSLKKELLVDDSSDSMKTYYSKNSVYYTILTEFIRYMSISFSHDDGIRVSVDDCPINNRLAKYLEELRQEYDKLYNINMFSTSSKWSNPIINDYKPYILKADYLDDDKPVKVNTVNEDDINLSSVLTTADTTISTSKYGIGGSNWKNINMKFH